MKRVLTAAVPALLVLLADQWLKAVSAGQHRVLIPGVLSLSYTLNTGFALGLFPDSALAATVLSAGMMLLVLFLMCRFSWNGRCLCAFGLVLGGALGNLIDRIFLSAVRDMLHLDFMRFYVFNLADAAVVTGVLLLALFTLTERKEA